ncbi:polysaccharide deacetylase family protein [Paraburkholderia sp. WC7.3g]|uniref:polysaccharide deacetylase family protein n=1 Tax=Paraburkholderia sp. WC7.3g TaxID=2991070 RepID=UPI003D1D55F7
MKVLDCVSEAREECHDGAGCRDGYLTFDDGPSPLCTPDVLDGLAEHRVPATFCVICAYVEDQLKLIQRVIDEGHEIANHTMIHPDLSRCVPDEVRRQILDENRIIRMACPQAAVRHTRAPYGICGRTKWSLKWQRRGWRLLTGR